MARIDFSTCKENERSNQVPRIMFFNVRAVTRWFSFGWQCWSLKTWTRKSLFITMLRSGIILESLENKNVKKKTKRDVKLLETFLRNAESDEREMQNIEPADKQAPCWLYSFCQKLVLLKIHHMLSKFATHHRKLIIQPSLVESSIAEEYWMIPWWYSAAKLLV